MFLEFMEKRGRCTIAGITALEQLFKVCCSVSLLLSGKIAIDFAEIKSNVEMHCREVE